MTVTAEGGSGGHRGSPFGQSRKGEGRWRPSGLAPRPEEAPEPPVPAGTPPGPSPAPSLLPPQPTGRLQVRPGCGRSPPKPALGKKSTLNQIQKGKKESTRRPPARRAALGGACRGLPLEGPGSPPCPRGLCTSPPTPPGPHPRLCPKGICNTPGPSAGEGAPLVFIISIFLIILPSFFLSSGGLDGHGRGERKAGVENTPSLGKLWGGPPQDGDTRGLRSTITAGVSCTTVSPIGFLVGLVGLKKLTKNSPCDL